MIHDQRKQIKKKITKNMYFHMYSVYSIYTIGSLEKRLPNRHIFIHTNGEIRKVDQKCCCNVSSNPYYI